MTENTKSSPSSSSDAIERLRRPLAYAARHNFANLAVVRNLASALSAPVAALGDLPVRSKFEAELEGLDALDLPDKRRRIEALLALLDDATAFEAPKKPATKKFVQAAPRVEVEAGPKRRTAERATPQTPVSAVFGPKSAERLEAAGFSTVQDLLFFVPRRYEDRSSFTPIAQLTPGTAATVLGEVKAAAMRPIGRGKRMFELAVSDATGTLNCRFFRFHGSQMESRYGRGTKVVVSGPVTAFGAMRQMVHPELRLLDDDELAAPGGIVPIYGEIDGIPAKTLRTKLAALVPVVAPQVVDPLPPQILQRQQLVPLGQALLLAHQPSSADTSVLEVMRRRLVFGEVFALSLALLLARRQRAAEPGLAHPVPDWRQVAGFLPFTLTADQAAAMEAIREDLARPRPMHRLLQGEVGSGKTAVALLAAALVHQAGAQTALLAPTEILAEQHFRTALKWLEPQGLRVGLLTGSTSANDRKGLLARLADGHIHLLVGTHALLEPTVRFSKLGLAIIDEQHRFGVEQRAALRQKGADAIPDVLVMTATPIPRTLALTLYGDLDLTLIRQLPPGRGPTTTQVFGPSGRQRALDLVAKALSQGRRAYVVFPLIEASEKLQLKAATEELETLKERLAPFSVALLHGRMKAEEKSAVMAAFVDGRVQVLCSTTVIEVGVDVAAATVMMVENAERFGLSQLHQLRGRVGRGKDPGLCLLIAGSKDADAKARLDVLAQHTDGFLVAERDLALRGQGELLGTRQSGMPELILTDLVRDASMIEAARAEAEALLSEDPELLRFPLLRPKAGTRPD